MEVIQKFAKMRINDRWMRLPGKLFLGPLKEHYGDIKEAEGSRTRKAELLVGCFRASKLEVSTVGSMHVIT